MYHSILVPLDGSPFGEQALPLALSIARRTGASLEVAHVHETLPPVFSQPIHGLETPLDTEIRTRRAAYLGGVIKRLASQTKGPVAPAFLEGSVVEALLDRVSSREIDLVVMTTHGHGALARFWLGSVADQLVRQITVPVILVRPQQVLDLSQEPAIHKLLVPLDGSSLSERILDEAVPFSRVMEAELLLLRVIEPLVVGNLAGPEASAGSVPPSLTEKLESFHEQRRREAAAYLDKIAESLRSSCRGVQTCVISHEQPAVGILNEARTQKVDGIAIETHGRKGLSRFFLGSIADKVIRGASIPVLVHRTSDDHAAVEGTNRPGDG
jgi:nucleotide-binding universal stress UspA family protein